MQIGSYLLPDGVASYGLASEKGVQDVGSDFRSRYADLKAALEVGVLKEVGEAATGQPLTPVDRITWLPPVTKPDKILCIGLNYATHIKETGREAPKYPSIFTRYPSSLVGHDVALERPKASDKFDFEGELAVIIGRRGRHIDVADAFDHVAGYSCFNDGSIRDYQRHTTQFWAGKSFDRSGAIGPWMVTSDELTDPTAERMETRLNGQIVQSTPINDLAFDIPSLIAYVSTVTELLPGDIIATGTPSGVGLFREPQLWMKPGDRIEVEISGIGVLSNGIVDEG